MADSTSTDDDQVSSSNPPPNPPLNPENTPRRRRGRGRSRGGRGSFSPRFSRRDDGGGSSSAAAGGLPESLPILDSGNVAVAGGLVIGRSPTVGKRVREGGSGGSGDQGSPVKCTLCGKELKSPKALYGHMRAVHPGRVYIPPPVARAEQERVQNQPADAARSGGGGVEEGEIVGGGAEPMEVEEPPRRLPDLNFPPPPDDDV